MAISRIVIKNYKSIKKCSVSVNKINTFIGENGTGKSNILSAVNYFYKNLITQNIEKDIFDKNNKFNNKIEIAITFDMRMLKKRIKHNSAVQKNPQYAGFYKHINSMQDFETLKFTQIKDGKIFWSHKFDIRETIFYIFPLYYIDSRRIELTDWYELWNHIGDLIKLENNFSKELKYEITNTINDEKYNLGERFEKIEQSLTDANITLKPFTPKEFAAVISKISLFGESFIFNENKLHYFSNGTNAFNYTNILLNILKLISDFKLKEPFIILDEPEISLHHKLIDKMCENFFECSSKIIIIISTHSPRLLKNILKQDKNNCNIYHVIMNENYSQVSRFKLFNNNEARSKIVITDQHSNAYFAKKILAVEGETELEVFDNPYLTTMFYILKQSELTLGMSNDVVQKIISPKYRKYNTPIISLIDMDKVIIKTPQINRFQIVRNSPLNNRDYENYYYGIRREDTFKKRKRIQAMLNKCAFHYKIPFFTCKDSNFLELILCIKEYLKQYNIFVMSTTIEGALINNEVLDVFWEYLNYKYSGGANWKKFESLYNSSDRERKLNALRLLCNGKSDYILTLNQMETELPSLKKDIKETISQNKIEKTSGWVSEWIEFYICKILSIVPFKEDTFDNFLKVIKDKNKLHSLLVSFKMDFKELADLIDMLEKA